MCWLFPWQHHYWKLWQKGSLPWRTRSFEIAPRSNSYTTTPFFHCKKNPWASCDLWPLSNFFSSTLCSAFIATVHGDGALIIVVTIVCLMLWIVVTLKERCWFSKSRSPIRTISNNFSQCGICILELKSSLWLCMCKSLHIQPALESHHCWEVVSILTLLFYLFWVSHSWLYHFAPIHPNSYLLFYMEYI